MARSLALCSRDRYILRIWLVMSWIVITSCTCPVRGFEAILYYIFQCVGPKIVAFGGNLFRVSVLSRYLGSVTYAAPWELPRTRLLARRFKSYAQEVLKKLTCAFLYRLSSLQQTFNLQTHPLVHFSLPSSWSSLKKYPMKSSTHHSLDPKRTRMNGIPTRVSLLAYGYRRACR